MAALFLITMLFYPSVKTAAGLDEIINQIPEALLKAFVGDFLDFTSPEGYLNSQLFQMMLPLLLLIYSIRLGSNATAGEEEQGTMDLLLAHPLMRRRLVLDKAVAMAASTAVLASATWIGMWVGIAVVGMQIGVLRTVEATFSGLLLALAFGSLALAVGAATGRKGMATGVSVAIAVATYFLNALAPLVKGLQPFRKLSPFHYYIGGDPLTHGLNLAHAAVLAGIALACLIIAVVAFQRRDVGT